MTTTLHTSTWAYDSAALVGRQALHAAVRGPVLFSGDERIPGELAGYNAAPEHRPAAVVGAERPEDVAAAVRFAADNGLAVGVLATGHGGLTHGPDTVVVSTRRMNRYRVNETTARASVEAGVKWAPVISAAAAHGLAPLNGSTSDAGVVGYTVGGGMGPMARRFGWAADHVTSLDMVTADGRLRHVDADHDPDLFWAVRGGKATLGVVTGIEFNLMPVNRLYGGAIYYPGTHSADILDAYRQWAPTLGEEATSSIALLRLPDLPAVPPPLRGTLSVHLRYAHLGSPADGARVLAPMRAVAPALLDGVRDMPYSEVDSIHNDPTDPMPGWDRGVFLREFPAAAADALLEVAGPGVDLPLIMVELRQLGGAAARPATPANAVGGRDAGWTLGVVGPLPPPLRNVVPAVGHHVLERLRQWHTGTVPVNFAGDLDGPTDAGRAWDPSIRRRLEDIKHRYDPENTFRTGQTLDPRPWS